MSEPDPAVQGVATPEFFDLLRPAEQATLDAAGRRQRYPRGSVIFREGTPSASVIIVLPMCGDYYTNTYLTGGSPRTEMVGNQIEFYLRGTSQPQTGASLVIILMLFLMVAMAYYLVTIARSQREGAQK